MSQDQCVGVDQEQWRFRFDSVVFQAVGLHCVDIIPLMQNMPIFSWSVSADNYSGGSKAIVRNMSLT